MILCFSVLPPIVNTKNPKSVRYKEPIIKQMKANTVYERFFIVIGLLLFCPFFVVSHLKKNGGMTYAANTTQNIPTITTSPNCFIAGCLAKIRHPIPTNIIKAESATVLLYVLSIFLPNLFSYRQPSIMKIV